jgi:hypothetical protein
MANERDVIDSAYENLFCALFSTFFQSYTSAMGDEQREAEAERLFSKGVKHARFVRDRAIALLP